MIIFHEGMPRSGKSYAAFVDHILPALQSGRKVYARLDGLNFEQIARLIGVSVDRVLELLIHLDESDIAKLDSLSIDNDSLIVIDEVQNYFPDRRQPLSTGMSKFITEHGHHGFDILLMGQVLKDCHKLWRNRVNRKVQFIKKDMLGKPDEYKWKVYTGSLDGNGNVKFTHVSSGDGVYDPKYFGCYKSHSDGTENKGTYRDDRANVFKSRVFRLWLPVFCVFALICLGYVIYIFRGGMVKAPVKHTEFKPVKVEKVVITSGPGADRQVVHSVDGVVTKPVDGHNNNGVQKNDDRKDIFDLPDVVNQHNRDYRPRLAYVIRSAKRVRLALEWRDQANRVVDTLGLSDIEALGWRVLLSASDQMAVVVKGQQRFVASSWPVEEVVAKVSQAQQREIAGAAKPAM